MCNVQLEVSMVTKGTSWNLAVIGGRPWIITHNGLVKARYPIKTGP